MKTQSNIKAIPYPSLLEIIFSTKNKDYGAYALRKSYKRNMNIALVSTIILTILLLVGPGMLKNKSNVEVLLPDHGTNITPIDLSNAALEKDKQIIPQEPVQRLKETVKFVVPEVKPDDQVPDEYIPPESSELIDKNIGTKNIEGDPNGQYFIPDEIPAAGGDEIAPPVQETPFSWVEEMPIYPEGEDALINFIASNIRYPEIAKKAGIEGKVIIQFVIEKDGSLTDFQIIKGIGGGCDEEALRVLKLAGKWNPGKQNGKHVRVKMLMPFSFRLS